MAADRTGELRERAAECLAAALKALLPEVRVELLTIAQKFHELAEQDAPEIDRLDWAVRAFNAHQLSRH